MRLLIEMVIFMRIGLLIWTFCSGLSGDVRGSGSALDCKYLFPLLFFLSRSQENMKAEDYLVLSSYKLLIRDSGPYSQICVPRTVRKPGTQFPIDVRDTSYPAGHSSRFSAEGCSLAGHLKEELERRT